MRSITVVNRIRPACELDQLSEVMLTRAFGGSYGVKPYRKGVAEPRKGSGLKTLPDACMLARF